MFFSDKFLHIGDIYSKSSTSGIILESPLIQSSNFKKCLSFEMSMIANGQFKTDPSLTFMVKEYGQNSFT